MIDSELCLSFTEIFDMHVLPLSKKKGGLFSGCLFRGLGPSLIVRVTYDIRKELALIHDCIYIACKSMLKKTVLHCIYHYYIFLYSLQPYFLQSKGVAPYIGLNFAVYESLKGTCMV